MSTKLFAGLAALAIALVIFMQSIFIVHQTQQALVLEFGRAVKVVTEAGPSFKIPFIQNVIFFDKRLIDFNAESKEINASDQKRVIIDAFVRYRIVNPLKFYQTAYDENGMRARLNDILESSLKKVVGNYPLNALLSPARKTIMDLILRDVNRSAQGRIDISEEEDETGVVAQAAAEAAEAGGFGIEVVDVRIKRADLPETNSNAVYQRMETDREREAKELRAEGEEAAQRIRARAEKDRAVLLADAEKQAQIIRGEGDGIAAKIYADAYGRDSDFYAFYRSMQAYREAIRNDDTTMVLSPDSEFLRYLEKQSGRR